MKIRLERNYIFGNKTISTLYIDGKFVGYGLEDRIRPKGEKVAKETAIPYGEHEIRKSYSNKFLKIMPEIIVDNFSGIRIHRGVDESWSEGCLLVSDEVKNGKLVRNDAFADEVNAKIMKALDAGEKVTIKITKDNKYKLYAFGLIGSVLLIGGIVVLYKIYNKKI